jgi:hypothetical protein
VTGHLAEEELGRAEARQLARTDFDELMKTYPDCPRLAFDKWYVIAYGLLFTGILALAFAPTLLVMRRTGERLRNRSFPLPRPTSPAFDTTVVRRASFDALLETNLTATATFKAGIAIATPLAASLLSTALPV